MDERIGFGTRLGAAAIDFLPSFLLSFPIAALFGFSVGGVAGNFVAGAATFGAGVTVSLFLYSLIEEATGTSPGKRMLRIEIRDESRGPATQTALLMRWALKNIAFIGRAFTSVIRIPILSTFTSIVGFAVFGGYFLVLGESRQAFHDRFACTAVYRKQ